MMYLVELKQDNQNNSIIVKETKSYQCDIVRGWRVRYELHTFNSLEEVANFICNKYEVIDHSFYLNNEDKEKLIELINR